MIKEIYTRTKDDPYYEEGIMDYTNEMEEIISMIRVLLGTKPGDVLGDTKFGVNLDYLVFNTKKAGPEIAKDIKNQIQEYVPTKNNITIDTEVSFGHDENGADYALVDITINGAKAVGFLVDKEK